MSPEQRSELLQLSFQLIDRAAERFIAGAAVRDSFCRVQNICMGATESIPDFITGKFGQLAAEIHSHHARVRDIAGAAFTDHISEGDAEVVGDRPLN